MVGKVAVEAGKDFVLEVPRGNLIVRLHTRDTGQPKPATRRRDPFVKKRCRLASHEGIWRRVCV